MLERLATIPRATPEEVLELSEIFNVHVSSHFGLIGPSSVNKLWKQMLVADDGSIWGEGVQRSGSILYPDFERVVRNVLQLSSGAMPQEKLLALWQALDADGNGLVDQGEFVRFMRFGNANPMARKEQPEGRANKELESGGSSPLIPRASRRSRISADGENPEARNKERARLRAQRRAQQRDEAEVRGIYGGFEAKARQLEREALRLEAQLAEALDQKASGGHSAPPLRGGNGGNTPRLPNIRSRSSEMS